MPVAASNLTPLEEELLDLRDTVDELRAEIRARDIAYAPLDAFPREWDLMRSERIALSALVRAGGAPISTAGLQVRLYGAEGRLNTLRVLISRLRSKVAKAGVEIRTFSGLGYALDPDSARRLRPYLSQPGHH